MARRERRRNEPHRYLPEGLVEGCRLMRADRQGQVLTYDDVELPAGRLADACARNNTATSAVSTGSTTISARKSTTSLPEEGDDRYPIEASSAPRRQRSPSSTDGTAASTVQRTFDRRRLPAMTGRTSQEPDGGLGRGCVAGGRRPPDPPPSNGATRERCDHTSLPCCRPGKWAGRTRADGRGIQPDEPDIVPRFVPVTSKSRLLVRDDATPLTSRHRRSRAPPEWPLPSTARPTRRRYYGARTSRRPLLALADSNGRSPDPSRPFSAPAESAGDLECELDRHVPRDQLALIGHGLRQSALRHPRARSTC